MKSPQAHDGRLFCHDLLAAEVALCDSNTQNAKIVRKCYTRELQSRQTVLLNNCFCIVELELLQVIEFPVHFRRGLVC